MSRSRAGTLCMSQFDREQFLMTVELEGLAIADESQNGDIIDQMPQIIQNEIIQQNKALILGQSSKLNSGNSDSSQQSNQN